MSKQTQKYNPNPAPAECCTCVHFKSDVETLEGRDGKTYRKEKNLRCGIGGFAVRKKGTCIEHEFSE